VGEFLVGIGATDPFTFLTVSTVLSIATMAACYVPVRRAIRVDPMVALRYE
jgi:putative ABC transport system permease protein